MSREYNYLIVKSNLSTDYDFSLGISWAIFDRNKETCTSYYCLVKSATDQKANGIRKQLKSLDGIVSVNFRKNKPKMFRT